MSRPCSLSEFLSLLLRLAEDKLVVFLNCPCGIAFTELAGMAEPTVESSSVAIGEERPEDFLLVLTLLFLAVWRGPDLPRSATL
jgi:hypothetical protein